MPPVHHRLIPLFAAMALGLTAAARAETCSAEAQAFWETFRATALDRPAQVLPLTNFPFKTRGSLDSDPVVSVSKRQFPALFEQLLAKDPGLSTTPTTMRAYAKAHPQLSTLMCESDRRFRVGDWVFEQRHGKWSFVFAYTEEE